MAYIVVESDSGNATTVEVTHGPITINQGGDVVYRDYSVGDWVSIGSGEYSVTYSSASHGKGLATIFQVQKSSSGRWIAATEEFDAGQNATTGDITVKVNSADSRCAIRIVVI